MDDDRALRSKLIRLAAANPDLQKHLLPLLDESGRATIAATAKKPITNTDIREGYYKAGDGIVKLKEAVRSQESTKGDQKLLKAVKALDDAHTAVLRALDPYGWD